MTSSDKDTIFSLSKYFLHKGYFDAQVKYILEDENRSDKDYSYLLKYSLECQKVDGTRHQGLSIRTMKKTMLSLIGVDESLCSQSTLSRRDVEAIYTFITSLPSELFTKSRLYKSQYDD